MANEEIDILGTEEDVDYSGELQKLYGEYSTKNPPTPHHIETSNGGIKIPQNGLLKGLDDKGTTVMIAGQSTASHYLRLDKKDDNLYSYNVVGQFITDKNGKVTNEKMVCELMQDRLNILLQSNNVTSFDFGVHCGVNSDGSYVQRIEILFRIDEPNKQKVSRATLTGLFDTYDPKKSTKGRDSDFNNASFFGKKEDIRTDTITTRSQQAVKTKVGMILTRIDVQAASTTRERLPANKGLNLNVKETNKFPVGVKYFDMSGLPTQVTGTLQGKSHSETIPPVTAVYKQLDQTNTKTTLIHYKRPADASYFQLGTQYYQLDFNKVRQSFQHTIDIFSGPMSRKDMKTEDRRNIKGKCFINGLEESPKGRNEDTGTPISGVETWENSAIVIIKNGKQELTHYQEILSAYGTIDKFEANIKKNKRTVYQAPSVYRNGNYNPSLANDTSNFHRYLIEEQDGTIGVVELDFGGKPVSSRGAAQAINQIMNTKRIVYLDTGAVKLGSPANRPQNISAEGYVCGVVITGQKK